MDEEIAELLKTGGCHTVTFGLETGNEKIRSEVLGKTISNEDILKCSELLHRSGIRIQTSNMFCLPGETLDDAFSTVEMNIRIKADFVYCTLFMPFPGTRLANYCMEKGFLNPDFKLSDLPQSFLTKNVQKIAHWLVRFPFLLPAARRMITKFNFKKPYEFLLLLGTFFRYKEERKISFMNALRFLWRLRKSY
jgi:anaerobic magnesium-protoporphyrin IX monomethyl ester cyclase